MVEPRQAHRCWAPPVGGRLCARSSQSRFRQPNRSPTSRTRSNPTSGRAGGEDEAQRLRTKRSSAGGKPDRPAHRMARRAKPSSLPGLIAGPLRTSFAACHPAVPIPNRLRWPLRHPRRASYPDPAATTANASYTDMRGATTRKSAPRSRPGCPATSRGHRRRRSPAPYVQDRIDVPRRPRSLTRGNRSAIFALRPADTPGRLPRLSRARGALYGLHHRRPVAIAGPCGSTSPSASERLVRLRSTRSTAIAPRPKAPAPSRERRPGSPHTFVFADQ